MRLAIRIALFLFLLLPTLPGHAQFGNLTGSLTQKATDQLKSLLTKQIGQAIGAGSPLLLDQHSAFPDASTSVTNFHQAKLLKPTAADLSMPLAPGDYVVAVTGYCSQFSIHAPGAGLGYKLAREQGPEAPAISMLLVRGTAQNISPYTLNADAWRIESGMPLNQWPDQDQALVHHLIPEHEKELQGDFVQQLRNTYDEHSSVKIIGKRIRVPNLPSFEVLLTQLGEPGKAVIQLQKARQVLSDKTISAERLPEMLYEPTDDGQPRVLPPSDDPSPSPWAEVQPGVYARLTIIDGNMGRNRFEFRVTSAAFQPVAVAVPHITNVAAFAVPGGLTLDTLYGAPSLSSILEGAAPTLARFAVIGGEVVLVGAEGAAAVVSSPVILTGTGVVLIGYSIYRAAQVLGLLPMMNQDNREGNDKPGNETGEQGDKQFPELDPNDLPDEEKDALNDTLNNIKDGRASGKNYQNRATPNQDKLPGGPGDTYTEYDVDPAPGSKTRGPRRIVKDNTTGKEYYTNTHYGDSGKPSFYTLK